MAHYTQFFGFQTRPFNTSGGRSPVLGTQSLQKALEGIQAALEKDIPVIVVQGPPGVGKSSFARVLPKLLARERRAFVAKNPSLEDLEEALHGSNPSEASIEERQPAPTLILDDAESVSEGFLETLSTILTEWTGSPGLSCVLVTNRTGSFETGNGVPTALDGLVSQAIELEPLSSMGTKRYIEKHIQRAGAENKTLFPEEVMRAIHMRSQGIPREISRLCEDLLKRAARSQSKTLDPEWLEESEFEASGAPDSEVQDPILSTPSTLIGEQDEIMEAPVRDPDQSLRNSGPETGSDGSRESSTTKKPDPGKRRRLALRFGFATLTILLATVCGFLLDPLGSQTHQQPERELEQRATTPFPSSEKPNPKPRTATSSGPLRPTRTVPLPLLDPFESGAEAMPGPFVWSPPKKAELRPPINTEAPGLWMENQKLLLQIRASAAAGPSRHPQPIPSDRPRSNPKSGSAISLNRP